MAPCWLSFGASGAPGHASGSSMCTKGVLDPSWEHFGSELVAQRVDFEGPGLNWGSILHAFCGSSGSRARFWGLSVPQGWPGSILGSIL